MPNSQNLSDCQTYHIRVAGCIDPKWSDWFNGFTITHLEVGESLLCGAVSDQAALYGLLAKISDLGLPLLYLNRLDEIERTAPDPE